MNSLNFKIGDREIGANQPVFIIAELSSNHNGSFEKAKEMVKAACRAGADIIKLQTNTPDSLTIDCDNKWFQVKVNPAWQGKTLYQLYQEVYTPWEWQAELKKLAQEQGALFFSTPVDIKAVEFLEKMDVPAYKIGSFEIGDIEFLKRVGQTKKPVILSRGMAQINEIKLALKTLSSSGAPDIALMHCVSSYPAQPEEINLKTIPDISERFKVIAGFSDHSLTISLPVAAVSLGAVIIEKHFTLKRSDGGLDVGFSLEPAEFAEMVKQIREVEKALGRVKYELGGKEKENVVFRRSLFVVKDIKAGGLFNRENVRSIRPGYGLAPRFLPKVLGKKAVQDIKRGTPLNQKMFN